MPYLFLRARQTDLDFARQLKTRLEDQGRTTWLDEGMDYIGETGSLNLIEDVIQYAGVVIVINGGNPDDIAVAQRFEKPILALGLNQDPAELLPYIEALFPDTGSTRLTPLPKPLDTAEIQRAERTSSD